MLHLASRSGSVTTGQNGVMEEKVRKGPFPAVGLKVLNLLSALSTAKLYRVIGRQGGQGRTRPGCTIGRIRAQNSVTCFHPRHKACVVWSLVPKSNLSKIASNTSGDPSMPENKVLQE